MELPSIDLFKMDKKKLTVFNAAHGCNLRKKEKK